MGNTRVMENSEQVKATADIVQVIGERVTLKRVGAGPRYVGLCPFHSEKTPSFSVHSGHQFYKCFGCGVGGDVFTFIMEMDHVGFYEALKYLAEKYGIALNQRSGAPDADGILRGALHAMHEIAVQTFQENLRSPQGREALAYLAKRGVNEETAHQFALGYSQPGWDQLTRRLQQEGFAPQQLEASGLVKKREQGGFYDAFRGRLMFPIHNESGRPIAFGGRALADGDEPKYLNSSETAIYRKTSVLYNLHRAKDAMRQNNHAILVEGYMDVIGVSAAGVPEVVASCGTALTGQQIQSIRRFTRTVLLSLDPDAAGAKASDRSLALFLGEGMKIRVVELAPGLDPDEYVRQVGPDVFRERLSKAREYFDWLAFRVRERFGNQEARERVAALEEILPTVALVPNEVEKLAIASQLAEFFGVETSYVYRHFRQAGRGRGRPVPAPAAVPKDTIPLQESALLNTLLKSSEAQEYALPVLARLQIRETFRTRAIFAALLEAFEPGQPVTYDLLAARLDEEQKALLASLVFADEEGSGEMAINDLRANLQQLVLQEYKWQSAQLKQKIKEAERAGDMQAALRWNEELSRLGKPQ